MKTPTSLASKRICRYVRVSTDAQEGDRQIYSTDSWAKYNGLFIQESFEDTEGNNSRDKSAKRVQFQKMMKLCESGDYDAIVVDSLDRFGFKNNKELQHYLYLLDKWGTELWSVSQGCISEDDVATIFNTTAAAITSEKEQREKGLRNLEGRMNNSKKGNYSGGPPPYGCDIVCYATDGSEKWRVVWMGRQQRLKISADGTREEYNGKNNFPSRDANDTLKLAPTVKMERIEAVKQIFQWFANETISYYQIAVRLNEQNVKTVLGEEKCWNKGHVQKLLCNPIFIGIPTDNKKGQSRFYQYVNGKVCLVTGDEENRVRNEKDRWRPENPIFDPIVPPDVFYAVQEKLALRNYAKPVRNPQRRDEFWVQPFVHCHACSKKMRNCKVQNGETKDFCNYFCCATYSTYGRINEYDCQSNTVRKEFIEEIVDAYLTEAKQKLAFDNFLDNLYATYKFSTLDELSKKANIKITVEDDFKDFVRQQLGGHEIKGGISLSETYRIADQEREANDDIVGRIKAKQDEFEKAYQHSKYLTDFAKERANEEMNLISKEIRELRSSLAPQDRCQKIEREIDTLDRRIDNAVMALKMNNPRHKTEAIGKVIDKIICKFERVTAENKHLVPGKFGAQKRKTILTEIRIVPVSLEKEFFRITGADKSLSRLDSAPENVLLCRPVSPAKG